MKKLFRNSIHTQSKSHDCLIAEIKGKKVKMTYEAYNAVERCTIQVFDGFEFKHILSIMDMGIESDNSAYIWSDVKRKARTEELFKIAEKMCNGIF